VVAMNKDEEDVQLVLVDDDLDFRGYVKRYLEQKGFRVNAYAHGGQLKTVLERTKPENFPDLIIMDTQLPGHPGYRVCADLKELYVDQVSILGMSQDRNYAQNWEAAGADGFLCKSQLVPQLEEKIDQILSKQN